MKSTLVLNQKNIKIKTHHGKSFYTQKAAGVLWKIFRTAMIIGLGFVLVYPLIFMLSTSIRPTSQLNDVTVNWIPKSLTFDNYILAAKALNYWDTLMNTFYIDIVSACIQVVACSLVAYGFARYEFKGKNFLFALVIFTIIVPPQLTILPTYINYRFFDFFGLTKLLQIFTGKHITINLINTIWTFYLPAIFGVGLRSGLFIFILRQFFRGMPKELEESAKIDGCSPIMVFFKIMVPSSIPAFITVFLFSVVWYWNDFYNASMFYTKKLPISVQLGRIRMGVDAASSGMTEKTVLEAACILIIVPLVILYICTQKHYTESIERTGIVG